MAREIIGCERFIVRIKAGQVAELRVIVGASHANRTRQIRHRTVIKIFEVQADIALIKFLGDVALNLETTVGVKPCFARAFAFAVKPAEMEAHTVAQATTIAEIKTIFVIIKPATRLNCATFFFTSVRNQIDDTAWCV